MKKFIFRIVLVGLVSTLLFYLFYRFINHSSSCFFGGFDNTTGTHRCNILVKIE
ncbi:MULTISPECIES: hypothetical protein [unclassified Enterococcus]|jgi:hypothetical protein|uniref:hypothetical protein n=1 Tax=unclassified Enterococcus TaxID=2608891 RepID=UPI003D2E916D